MIMQCAKKVILCVSIAIASGWVGNALADDSEPSPLVPQNLMKLLHFYIRAKDYNLH
jgi:hypothetical protein